MIGMIGLDESKYWMIGDMMEVRVADIVIAVSTNQYEACPVMPVTAGGILCRNPDACGHASFTLPADRFDYALRRKPTGVTTARLADWRPDHARACPDCHARRWRNDGVQHTDTPDGGLLWRIRWRCTTCGHVTAETRR